MTEINRHYRILLILLAILTVNIHSVLFAAAGRVKARETHQTMAGFGASLAFYENWLVAHPNKNEIYDYIFIDLGLDLLRIRNVYRTGAINITNSSYPEIVSAMYDRSDPAPKLFMSSWTPPSNLKSNNGLNGGTLKKENGKYVYGGFAKYWVDALAAYYANGIEPDYFSIQNEPTFETTGWETCRFDATENASVAGYDRALDSVYYALQAAGLHPKILAAEVHGIGYNTFQNYAARLKRNLVDGYAYHLYHGESDNVSDNHNPDLFRNNLSAIARSYGDKPIFQTEYDRGDWLNTVWLIHNCLVHGNVSAYFYWALAWTAESGKGLILMEFPWDRSRWRTPQGYILPTEYWAFRQYSKFIDSGWKRVTTEVDDDSLRMSAFIHPEGNKLTLVIINIGRQNRELSFDIQDFNVSDGQVSRTSATEDGLDISDNYDGTTSLEFPARSITTISFSGDLASAVEDERPVPKQFTLYQNYPNPFNPSTTIRYSLPNAGKVNVTIYNVQGMKIRALVDSFQNAGEHAWVWDGRDDGSDPVASGVYVCLLHANGMELQRKMMLVQ